MGPHSPAKLMISVKVGDGATLFDVPGLQLTPMFHNISLPSVRVASIPNIISIG
jgi:hypothetical protein